MTRQNRSKIEVCVCEHGSDHHQDRYGVCLYPSLENRSIWCKCKGFRLSWYIENGVKQTA